MEQQTLFGVEIEKKEEKKPKFKDCEGLFSLNGVIIKYKFEADKFGIPHFVFESIVKKKPNDLTETGFKSYFCDVDLNNFGSIEKVIEAYCKAELKNKPCILGFEVEEVEEEEVKKEERKYKIIVEETYSYNNNYEIIEDFSVWVEGENCIYHSSGEKSGQLMKEGKYKEALENSISYCKEGKEGEFEIEYRRRTEEQKQETLKTIKERKKYYSGIDNKQIERLSYELKELLKKRYGCEVKLIVERREKNAD